MLNKLVPIEMASIFLKSPKQNGFNSTQAYVFGSVVSGQHFPTISCRTFQKKNTTNVQY